MCVPSKHCATIHNLHTQPLPSSSQFLFCPPLRLPPWIPAMLYAFLLIWTAVAEKMKPKETANKNRNSCNNFAQHGLDFLEFFYFCLFFFPSSFSSPLSSLFHTTPSVLGPAMEQEILPSSAHSVIQKQCWRPFWITSSKTSRTPARHRVQGGGGAETREMSWESCHQRQVQRFTKIKNKNRPSSQICSFSGCCWQWLCLLWVEPTEAVLFISWNVCTHLPKWTLFWSLYWTVVYSSLTLHPSSLSQKPRHDKVACKCKRLLEEQC